MASLNKLSPVSQDYTYFFHEIEKENLSLNIVFYWLMFKFMRFYIYLLIKHNQFSFFWLERLDFKHTNVINCALHNSSGCNLKRFPSRNIRTRKLRVS